MPARVHSICGGARVDSAFSYGHTQRSHWADGHRLVCKHAEASAQNQVSRGDAGDAGNKPRSEPTKEAVKVQAQMASHTYGSSKSLTSSSGKSAAKMASPALDQAGDSRKIDISETQTHGSSRSLASSSGKSAVKMASPALDQAGKSRKLEIIKTQKSVDLLAVLLLCALRPSDGCARSVYVTSTRPVRACARTNG